MGLTNAEKQRRWRERNQVILTERAEDIAEKLIDLSDQAKLRKISRLINNHLKNPNRSQVERDVDLGKRGATSNGKRLGKRAAVQAIEQAYKQEAADIRELERAYMANEITQEEFADAMHWANKWPTKLQRPIVT